MGSSSPRTRERILGHRGLAGYIHPSFAINVHGLGLRLAQIFVVCPTSGLKCARTLPGGRRDGYDTRSYNVRGTYVREPMENLFTLGSPRIASRSSPPQPRSPTTMRTTVNAHYNGFMLLIRTHLGGIWIIEQICRINDLTVGGRVGGGREGG